MSTNTMSHPLPSFQQAFSAGNMNRDHNQSNALPPLQSSNNANNNPPSPRARQLSSSEQTLVRTSDIRTSVGQKRTRTSENDDETLIKQEEERDDSMNTDNEPPRPAQSAPLPSMTTTSNSLTVMVTPTGAKRRRMTISTDTRLPTTEETTCTTPVSPVVMGFTMARDDPAAMETVRSTLAAKERQRVIIEQRRGSLQHHPMSEERSRKNMRKPSPGNNQPRPRSPPANLPSVHLPPPSTTLPPPPISFAHRRNLMGPAAKRKKPADIVISPRSAHAQDDLQPAIQSAPPVPSFNAMTLPRLPPVLGHAGERDTGPQRRMAQVPPTPGRLSRPTVPAHRSPPTTSVPIASSLVPPTPSFLKPSFGSSAPGVPASEDKDKKAFLAQFELFYDALNDSKQLKSWLNDQLIRSSQLTERLEKSTQRYEDVIDGLQREIGSLRARVDELEDRLRYSGLPPPLPSSRRNSIEYSPRKSVRHSPMPAPPMPQEAYTFPSHGERSPPQREALPPTEDAPYSSRRLSVSAVRTMDGPPRNHHAYPPRDYPLLPPPPGGNKEASRPTLTRQNSNSLRNRFEREDELIRKRGSMAVD